MTIDTSMRVVDLTLDDFDLAIRFSTTKKPAPNWMLLVAETLVPVCSPKLKRQFGLADSDLLARAPLIHVTSLSADWQHWFRASGTSPPASVDGGLRVDTVQMALDAATRGLGVALGRAPLVDDDIGSGRLVPLFGKPITSDGLLLAGHLTERFSETRGYAVPAVASF